MRPIPALAIPCLPLLLAAALPATVRAHETMPANWCANPDAKPQIVATFSFTRQQLRAMARQVEETLGPEGLIAEGLAEREADGRCGIVDRWNMATYIAQHYCGAASGNPNVIINITAPSAYSSPQHHTVFNYEDGLQGSCAVCTAPE